MDPEFTQKEYKNFYGARCVSTLLFGLLTDFCWTRCNISRLILTKTEENATPSLISAVKLFRLGFRSPGSNYIFSNDAFRLFTRTELCDDSSSRASFNFSFRVQKTALQR